eukprot:92225-Prymnesium_polylepis.2
MTSRVCPQTMWRMAAVRGGLTMDRSGNEGGCGSEIEISKLFVHAMRKSCSRNPWGSSSALRPSQRRPSLARSPRRSHSRALPPGPAPLRPPRTATPCRRYHLYHRECSTGRHLACARRTVAVVDAEESVRAVRPEWVCHAAAVLVDLVVRLARTVPGLNAVAGEGSNNELGER